MVIIRALLGRRQRNRGLSMFLLIGGLLACVVGCPIAGFGVPYSLYRARQVANLPQPQPAKLATTAPGTAILATAQLPIDVATNELGMALYFVESRPLNNSRNAGSGNANSSSLDWQMVEPPPTQVELYLPDGIVLVVQLPPKPSFLNAQQAVAETPPNQETDSSENVVPEEHRTTGYLPGQTLSIEGTWEGDNRLTAQTLYAGSPAEYIDYLTYTQPGSALLMGAVCGGLGLLLLIIGGAFRLVGR